MRPAPTHLLLLLTSTASFRGPGSRTRTRVARFTPLDATCRICRTTYSPSNNPTDVCRYHPGPFRGESARKGDWEGVRGAAGSSSGELVFSWSCCGGKEGSPGCVSGRHSSYDDVGG
eukprot:CAMPEP_0194306148 /NCGR_PEP_ID=MMETSP0171-20130528/3402_1 /TAXON_ID=218684 /ORGANISM="Corethron pennatum, Strain L29A3" /LENGTH=116 /DNA_ID=CAMNT_0039057871 /DNA_START=81 /DNA_END=431 /DNA_ORIENTATION=+